MCSSPWELSLRAFQWCVALPCTHRGQIDSRLLVVGNQIASLTPSLFFCHNLCHGCPNGPCKTIFDIYTSIVFQWYKEYPNARCFDLCNWTLKFWKTQKIFKSQFQKCEFHPHTSLKVRLQQHLWVLWLHRLLLQPQILHVHNILLLVAWTLFMDLYLLLNLIAFVSIL